MAESNSHVITILGKDDVLIGRGTGPNVNEGNVHFRDLVATRKAEYLAIYPRDLKNKNRIALEIIETVRSRGGRFLRKVAASNESGGAYELADEPTVMEKAKQALRQKWTGKPKPTKAISAAGADVRGVARHTKSHASAKITKSRAPAKSTKSHAPANTKSHAAVKTDVDVGQQPHKVLKLSRQNPENQLVEPDLYQAFLAHIRHDARGTSPAEGAKKNSQVQNYMVQQQGPRPNLPQANSALQHKPYFATSGDVVPGQLNNVIPLQQYEALQQHAYQSGNGPRRVSAEETDSDSMSYRPTQRQMNLGTQNFSGFVRNTPSLPQSRGQFDNPLASLGATTGNAVSDSQIRALENIFAGASQNAKSEHIARNNNKSHSESLIDGLEDMSLPSMSIGEMSDFSAHGASLSRSRRSIGGTIAESTEEQGCMPPPPARLGGPFESLNANGHTLSESKMKALEKIFAGTSGRRQEEEDGNGRDKDPLMDVMEDMSFLSISVDDVSELSALKEPYLRWKRSLGGTASLGGTIAKTADVASNADGYFRDAMDPAQKESNERTHSLSDSQMKSLEKIFANASQNNLTYPHQDPAPARTRTKRDRSIGSFATDSLKARSIGSFPGDSFEAMEEMSIPSFSNGKTTEMTPPSKFQQAAQCMW